MKPTREPRYRRVTEEQREQMERWKREGKGVREMARLLAKAPSTVSRELRRNRGGRGYRHKQAHAKAMERARRGGFRKWTSEMREETGTLLRAGWTPAMISWRARKEGRVFVSRETIYQRLYQEAEKGDETWKYLVRAGRKRKRRCPRVEGRGRGIIPNRKGIEERPARVELREEGGHWEGDLVVGAGNTGYLVTLVERRSRYTLVGYVKEKTSRLVSEELIRMLKRTSVLRTLTVDNGKEFAGHEAVAAASGAEVYFARPYHSWERGSNENVNGHIRRRYPKGASFREFGEDGGRAIEALEARLNNRPMRCLGWETPAEAMAELVRAETRG